MSFEPDRRDSKRILAAIASGDLDAATDTSFFIPGMNNHTDTSMVANVENALSLRREQARALRANGVNGRNVVTVAWLGYDTPSLLTEPRTAQAEVGGEKLARALDGYQATVSDNGRPVRTNVVAHSYGTTTTGYALTRTETKVNSAVLLASAGLPNGVADHASDLNVKSINGHPNVYASQAAKDRLAPTGRQFSWGHSVDPNNLDPRVTGYHSDINGYPQPEYGRPRDFGAQIFSSEGGTVTSGADKGRVYGRVEGHAQAFDERNRYGYVETERHNRTDRSAGSLYYTAYATMNLWNLRGGMV